MIGSSYDAIVASYPNSPDLSSYETNGTFGPQAIGEVVASGAVAGVLGTAGYLSTANQPLASTVTESFDIAEFLGESIDAGIVTAEESYWLASTATTFEELLAVVALL